MAFTNKMQIENKLRRNLLFTSNILRNIKEKIQQSNVNACVVWLQIDKTYYEKHKFAACANKLPLYVQPVEMSMRNRRHYPLNSNSVFRCAHLILLRYSD